MCAGRTMEGAGCVTWWGFSPALDLLSSGPARQEGDVNVLLIGSGDPRHILKTVAHLGDTDTLHIWVIENSLEVVARQLLLLYLTLVPQESMGPQEKTETFLELFGNSKIRSQTEQTLRCVASQLSLSVTDTLTGPTNPCLDTTHLRFKDRDELDRIFKQWVHPPPPPLSMSKVWDNRVRQHLGTRYDSRLGCFDWDLNMQLHQKGCGVIAKHQYVAWRERGVAFEMREALYEATNHSLLSLRVFNHRGGRVVVQGYWGDIVSSPYLAFGIETENEALLKTQNGQHMKTAQDISYHNVQELLKAVSSRGCVPACAQQGGTAEDVPPDGGGVERTGSPTVRPRPSRENREVPNSAGAHSTETGGLLYIPPISFYRWSIRGAQAFEHGKNSTSLFTITALCIVFILCCFVALLSLNGVSVTFLPVESLSRLPEKPKYSYLFNTIYCSASMVHQLGPSLKQIAAPNAVLVVELAEYLLDLSKEQVMGFSKKVDDIAQEAGFTPYEGKKRNAFSTFMLQEKEENCSSTLFS
ncbi:dynein assembly factor 3, axonemal [Scleropages formosus]|uniref:dynein assembly factor 3, axonemal n=1 Tax=Scleropages formosus TaxID=113540 RepID=UPI0010FA8E74|nr:dynein assembly factor 3, axonemal [Scleropages formosus]